MRLTILFLCSLVTWCSVIASTVRADEISDDFTLADLVSTQTAAHPGLTGAYVLEHGEDALYARAWLADHAVRSIEVQYFIWSADNIGILASEALLRAAERGVKVRVIVDDLLIDAPDRSLVALAMHPNVSIRIYNPKHNVGNNILTRLWHVATNFRSANQRMHNKTFIVDGEVAITGGRNMADEYFDFDHDYNFRDREMFVVGPVVKAMANSFDAYWGNELAVPVAELLGATGHWLQPGDAGQVYRDLHAYAADPGNFDDAARQAVRNIPGRFKALFSGMAWTNVHFLADAPGKNKNRFRLDGGGRITASLADLARSAEKRLTIQTPYLVLSDDAFRLFRELIGRGVKIRISTNSLSASDNLPAFSGYSRQRSELLEMGVDVYEFKPYPAIRQTVMRRYPQLKDYNPVFALHAKTMVVDGEGLYIGTYNLDPRSQNLNTEVGVLLFNERLAGEVETNIEQDMQRGNSWNARIENGDDDAGLVKRTRSLFWQFLPLDPIL